MCSSYVNKDIIEEDDDGFIKLFSAKTRLSISKPVISFRFYLF